MNRRRADWTMMSEKWHRALAWGLVIVIPLLITSTVIALAVNCQPLYEYGFNQYEVSSVTGLSSSELERIAGGLIDYFNSDREFIDITTGQGAQAFELFNEREIIHLYDVKELIQLNYAVLAGSIIYTALVYLLPRHRRSPRLTAPAVFWGGALTLAAVLGLAAAAAVDFNAFFTQFHIISFANDFWLLDPTTDYLIMLFPSGFWRDAALFTGIGIGITAAAVFYCGWRNIRNLS